MYQIPEHAMSENKRKNNPIIKFMPVTGSTQLFTFNFYAALHKT